MKIKSGFVVEKVGGAHLAVAVGERATEINALIRMNDTGAFLWGELEKKDLTEGELVKALTQEYEVAESMAEKDVKAFVVKLREGGLLDE